MNIAKYLLGILLLISILVACKQNNTSSANQGDYLLRLKKYHCEEKALTMESDSLWNEVADHMDKLLPAKMDPAVRKRIIDIKNTEIIRTFKIYHTFPDTIKHILVQIDEYDAKLVRRISMNDKMLDSMEREKLHIMSSLEDNQSAKEAFEKSYTEKLSEPCN
ncbi:MAG TPA: hypothetical protein PK076_12450 [Saprospiraceae bacterium]|nr:hypothetical protein [Saprospiraceae bacterium]HQW56936.1 hypothetical protein [Saprospiraceae bacterium]